MTIDELLEKYPKELVKNRTIIEGNFIFCLWKDPELYGDYYKKINVNKDLLLDDSRFYYSIGLEMYNLEYESFDEATVAIYLENRETLKDGFDNRGGYQTVKEIIRILNEENVTTYYDELVRSNILLNLYDKGFNVEKDLDKLNKMTSDQIYDYYDYMLSNIMVNKVSHINTVDLTTGYEKWIESWDKGSGVGYRVGFPMLNYHLAGIHKSNLILHLAGIGQGKAQPLYSKILTPDGYVLMKDIKVGDKIFGEDGKIHHVVGVYPQGKKDIYEITFSDGSKVRSCDEHLWTVQTPKMRMKNKFKTVTLKDIINDKLYKTNRHGYKQWKYYIPMTKPLKFDVRDIKIHPYILGLLLGDGGFSDGSIMFSSSEEDIIGALDEYCQSIELSLNYSGDTSYRLTDYNYGSNKENKIKQELKKLGLCGLLSHEKFIPRQYLFNSVQNRIDLLSGLIDSDGEVNGDRYTFSTTSEQLLKDVQFLVQSLGGTANVEDRQTHYTYKGKKKAGKPSYRLHIKMPRDIQAFKSEKHKKKFKLGQTEARRTIRDIKYIGKEEAQCIMTDNPTHLYLTDDMVVTHNTTSSLLMYILPIIKSGESVCIIANEQGEEEFRQMLLATVLFNEVGYFKMNRQKFLFGNFTDEDKKYIKKAILWLKQYENQIHYTHLYNYDVTNVKRLIKKYSKIGVGCYLFDTLKPQDDSSEKAWGDFSEVAKELFLTAQEENVAVIATAQLSSAASHRKFLDLSCVGKSRAIAETAGQVIMFRALTEKEKENLNVYTYAKDSNGKYLNVKQKHELNPDKDYIVLFVPKNRYGKAGNLQIVYERNMDFNTMKEIGYCNIEYDGFNK